jgi:hypothetical protein
MAGIMQDPVDYSLYRCPYSHLEKECGHQLHGPEGYEDVYGVWCPCGFQGPVFCLDPDDLGLELIAPNQLCTDPQPPFKSITRALDALKLRQRSYAEKARDSFPIEGSDPTLRDMYRDIAHHDRQAIDMIAQWLGELPRSNHG